MKLLVGTSVDHFHELDFDPAEQSLHIISSTEAQAPAWLCLDGGSLFAVSEIDQLGKVSRFEKSQGEWKSVWKVDSSSESTCHCSVAKAEDQKFLLSANYAGHTVDVHDFDGKLLSSISFHGSGPFEGRQESSHCHQIIQDLERKYVYVNDLGGDTLHRYSLDGNGKLSEAGKIDFKPGQGPRHTTFHPHHPTLTYTICELSNEILIHSWDNGGSDTSKKATLLQSTSILPDPEKMKGGQHPRYPQPASAGEIQITVDGKFLYASTRYLPTAYDSDTLLYYRINDEDGLLKSDGVTHMDTGRVAPWHFDIGGEEGQNYLAAAFKDSDAVHVYARNGATGSLREVSRLHVESPSCVLFVPAEGVDAAQP